MRYIKYIIPLVFFLTGGFFTSFAQLTEDFEGNFPPPGWAAFDNGVGTTNSWQKSQIRPQNGNNHAYVRFTNITTMLAEDWLVTPKLLPDVGDNTLTFYATDDFPADYGSIYSVRVSTTSQSDAGTFETVAFYFESDFTNDVYQQFTVDLSDYNGQEIYVAFVLENSNGDSFFLDNVSGPTAATVASPPNCDALLITPDVLTDVSVTSDLEWEGASGDPLGYVIRIGTSSGGDEFLLPTDIGSNTIYNPATNFDYSTTYYVTILPYNAQGNASIGTCNEFSFTTEASPDIILDCNGDPNSSVNQTLCYGNLFTKEFTITSNGNEQVLLDFNAGTLEDGLDFIYIYDGIDDSGNLLNSGKLSGNNGDLSGLSYVSSTGTLFVRLVTDVNESCENGSQTALDYTASCVACNPPVGTASISSNCDSENSQFYINVNITDLGDGSVSVENNQFPGSYTISTLGVTEIGPFNFGTVILTLENSTNSNCSLTLPALTRNGCPLSNDVCSGAIPLALSTDDNCNNATLGTTIGASLSNGITPCEGPNTDDDVWYSFTPNASDHYTFELANESLPVGMVVYDGTCAGALTNLTDCLPDDTKASVELTQGVTYLIQVFTIDLGNSSNFSLCVYPTPDAPINDLCSSAVEITDNTTLVGEDATYATATDALGCNDNPIGNGMWYNFLGTGTSVTISVTPDLWDCEIQLWSGADCNNLSCEMMTDEGATDAVETIMDFATISGAEYYIYVGSFAASGKPGMFEMTVAFAPPLATELLAFRGFATEKTNVLYWKIGTETNVESYVVERSLNGRDDWSKVGTVTALNQGEMTYELVDESPIELAYYRLKIIEQSGMTEFSDVISIKHEKDSNIMVFPNPVDNLLTFEFFSFIEGKTILELTDGLGRVVYQQNVERVEGINTFQIALYEFPSGAYTLRLDDGTQLITARVMKR